MFARFVTLLPLVAFAAVAAAAPNVLEARTTCNSGSEYCCNKELTNYSTTFTKGLLSALLDVNGAVQCSPVGVISPFGNGAQCTQQTVCCEDVDQNGLVNVACMPIAVSA